MAKRAHRKKPDQAGKKSAAGAGKDTAVLAAARIDAAGNPISAEDRERFTAAVAQIYAAAQKAFADNGFDDYAMASIVIMRAAALVCAQSLSPTAPRPQVFYDFGAAFAAELAGRDLLFRQQREMHAKLFGGPALGSA